MGRAVWKRFVNLYYVMHGLLIASYALIRAYYPNSAAKSPREYMRGFIVTHEVEVMVTALMLCVLRSRNSPTLDDAVDSALLIIKAAIAYLFSITEWDWMVRYLIVWGLLSLMLRKPDLGPAPNVDVLTAASFIRRVAYNDRRLVSLAETSDKSNGKDSTDDKTWVVMLSASWSQRSNNLIPTFGEIADRYGNDQVKFGRVDISRWVEIGEKLEIDVSVTSPNIPCFVLFEHGQEARILPPRENDKRVLLDRDSIVRGFHLDKRILAAAALETKKTS